MIMRQYLTAALYKFVSLPDYKALQAPLQACCDAHHIKGTLLLAEEGINGTVAGLPEDIYALLNFLKSAPLFQGRLHTLEHKESYTEKMPFYRMKVKLKKEIVTLGVPGIDPNKMAGTYVKPNEWNQLISDPDTIVIDTRNDYEVTIGTFKGAVDPQTKTFRELPQWVEANQDLLKTKKKIAMFCTGGIRCEKSTAFMRTQGFDEVYHLEGGILKYLETVPQEQSLWEGECFVFDERVSVDHTLNPGHFEMCRACRQPISDEDKHSPQYIAGISCPHCYGSKTEAQIASARERQKQIELAKQRGQDHIGADIEHQRQDKMARIQRLNEKNNKKTPPKAKK